VTHRLTSGSAVFNDEHLVSCVGLVLVMRLAEQTGLGAPARREGLCRSAADQVGTGQPGGETGTVVEGMCAGADSIDDVDIVRSDEMNTLFNGATRRRRSL
jgi:hypothetical protein